MANTKSAKKAIRSSEKKRSHNAMWTKHLKDSIKALKAAVAAKTVKADDLTLKMTSLQKVLDKATKEKVIHKNKSNRLKSKYAKNIAARLAEKNTKSAE